MERKKTEIIIEEDVVKITGDKLNREEIANTLFAYLEHVAEELNVSELNLARTIVATYETELKKIHEEQK